MKVCGAQLGTIDIAKTRRSMMNTETRTDPIVNIEGPDEFQRLVLSAEVPVLLDLWAPWCAPCRMQAPILEELAQNAGNRVRIAKVNVDKVPEVAMKLHVQSIPTLIVFRGGKEERRFVGVQSAGSLGRALGL
jgi:thioredoxin